MTEHKPITNIKLTPYLVAIRVIERKLFGIDTVFMTSKLLLPKIKCPAASEHANLTSASLLSLFYL